MIFYEDGYTNLESFLARIALITQSELVSSISGIYRDSTSFSVSCSSGNLYYLFPRKIPDLDGNGVQKKDAFGNLVYKTSGDKLSEATNPRFAKCSSSQFDIRYIVNALVGKTFVNAWPTVSSCDPDWFPSGQDGTGADINMYRLGYNNTSCTIGYSPLNFNEVTASSTMFFYSPSMGTNYSNIFNIYNMHVAYTDEYDTASQKQVRYFHVLLFYRKKMSINGVYHYILGVVDESQHAISQFPQLTRVESVPGPAGPQGPAGQDGIDGIDGEIGPQGPVGPAGATPDITPIVEKLGLLSKLDYLSKYEGILDKVTLIANALPIISKAITKLMSKNVNSPDDLVFDGENKNADNLLTKNFGSVDLTPLITKLDELFTDNLSGGEKVKIGHLIELIASCFKGYKDLNQSTGLYAVLLKLAEKYLQVKGGA